MSMSPYRLVESVQTRGDASSPYLSSSFLPLVYLAGSTSLYELMGTANADSVSFVYGQRWEKFSMGGRA